MTLFDGDPMARLDRDAARAAANEGIDRAERAADPDWDAAAYAAVEKCALTMERFTTDDVWALVPRARESRALGPIIRRARKDGLIVPTGEYRTSSQVSRHGAPVAIWRSLIRPVFPA